MTERERALLQGKKINPLTANESALAYAVAHGSSEPTYETVAEIQVGEMAEQSGMYVFNIPSEQQQALEGNLSLYFNDASIPLEWFSAQDSYVYNTDIETGEPKGTPAYVVMLVEGKAAIIASDTPDLSNTTVRILKKVEQGGGGESPIAIVHVKATEFDESLEPTAAVLEDSVDEFKAAIESGKPVIVDFDMSGAYGQDYDANLHCYPVGASSVLRVNSVESWLVQSSLHFGGKTAHDLMVAISEKDGEMDAQECTITAHKFAELPEFTSATAGKVLGVNSEGKLAWVTPT